MYYHRIGPYGTWAYISSTAPSFSEAMRQGSEVYQQLKSLAKKKYGQSAGNVGDEGGVAPDIQTADEALDLIMDAISKAGYEGKVKIAMVRIFLEFFFLYFGYMLSSKTYIASPASTLSNMSICTTASQNKWRWLGDVLQDCASSEFYNEEEKKYDLDFKNPDSDKSKWVTYEQLADIYKRLVSKYPIVSIEDPFAENDWEAWSYFYKSSDFQIVGYEYQSLSNWSLY